MPRKQRFKPSRKPKPVTEAAQHPIIGQPSSTSSGQRPEPGPREAERSEIHPDDARRDEGGR